jgi:hypothetical protein
LSPSKQAFYLFCLVISGFDNSPVVDVLAFNAF